MRESRLEPPVVFIIFNRSEHARAVLDAITSARPRQLFVIADGPRAERPEDVSRCAQTRALIERIDWACDVRTDFSAVNLGAGRRIASGLDWVFEQVDRAIVLEDDCVPHPSFFRFCQELLDRYQDDERIGTICGSNFLMGKARNRWSYYASNFHALHGWATWRRSWQRADMSMRLWPEVRDNGWLIDLCGNERMAKFWAIRFERVYRGELNAWDYPYILSCWLEQTLALTPNVNLIDNIGFGADATNTTFIADFCDRPTEAMQFPLIHPPFFIRDAISDAEATRRRLLPERGSWWRRAARPLVHFATGRTRVRLEIPRAKLLERSVLEARAAPRATCRSAATASGLALAEHRDRLGEREEDH